MDVDKKMTWAHGQERASRRGGAGTCLLESQQHQITCNVTCIKCKCREELRSRTSNPASAEGRQLNPAGGLLGMSFTRQESRQTAGQRLDVAVCVRSVCCALRAVSCLLRRRTFDRWQAQAGFE